MADYIFLVPLFPLIGVLINGLLLGRLPRPVVSFIACGTVGLSFITSVMLLFELIGMEAGSRVLQQTLFAWIPSATFNANVAFLVDPLSAVMILVVTGVGFLIHVYSTGYMHHDPCFPCRLRLSPGISSEYSI